MHTYHFAPVQGHTDAAYRHFHNKNYSLQPLKYHTPFIRWEKDAIRTKDLKDTFSDLNAPLHLTPQIIFRDSRELNSLVQSLKEKGEKEINLNMGCPFPLQTGHGRGAATILNKELAEEIVKIVNDNPEVEFSVKMRLGLKDPDEWKTLLPYLNQLKLSFLAVHPRVAKQQYGGDLHLDEFAALLNDSKNPIIFNGDLKYPDQIHETFVKFPKIQGIMIGRGLLARPSLILEYKEGSEWNKAKRIERALNFHQDLYNHYSSVLCGESQLISKIQPFWEYSEEEIGRKAWKAIKKASNLAKYQTAIALIGN